MTNMGALINYGTIDNSNNNANGIINAGTCLGTGMIKGHWTDHGVVSQEISQAEYL